MKQLKIWSMMMLVVMALPMVVACGSDDDGNDSGNNDGTSTKFTIEIIVNKEFNLKDYDDKNSDGSYGIAGLVGIKKGQHIYFFGDGSCKGFYHKEDAYRLVNGKIETYNQKTSEPCFSYTLLSNDGKYMKVRMVDISEGEYVATLTLEEVQ